LGYTYDSLPWEGYAVLQHKSRLSSVILCLNFMKLLQAVIEYLDWKKICFPSAARSYKGSLYKFASFFGMKDIEKINIQDVHAFISSQMLICKPSTVRYTTAILKDFFKYYPGIVNSHHIQNHRFELPEIKYLTEEEFIKIDVSLSEWDGWELRAKLIHHLLWNTGIRVGELCSLSLDNIDLQNRYAKIITEKSKKSGHIMWSIRAHELFIRYLGLRLMRGGDNVFDITPRQVQRIITKITERVGIKGVTPHKYRHGKAHKILKDGGHIDDVSFILRHSSPVLTKQMYLRLDKKEYMGRLKRFV
jgi:integrase/recombinase XerD